MHLTANSPSLLPARRPQALRAQVRDIIRAHQKHFTAATWNNSVKVVAVRGYYLNALGKLNKNDRGIYDDAKFIITANHFSSYNANTDPSMWRSGVATLCAPQVVTYKPGYHGYNSKYGHKAFRQRSDVTVFRDGTEDYPVGTSHPKYGRCVARGLWTDAGRAKFWINDHRGGKTTTSSAGCQTVPPDQWDAYHSTLELLLARHQPELPRTKRWYSYLLVEDPRIVTCHV